MNILLQKVGGGKKNRQQVKGEVSLENLIGPYFLSWKHHISVDIMGSIAYKGVVVFLQLYIVPKFL